MTYGVATQLVGVRPWRSELAASPRSTAASDKEQRELKRVIGALDAIWAMSLTSAPLCSRVSDTEANGAGMGVA